MTFRKQLTAWLVERGMFDHDAAEVVREAEQGDPSFVSMKDRMSDDVEEYPAAIFGTLTIALRADALRWIDEHCPAAWYRPIVAGD